MRTRETNDSENVRCNSENVCTENECDTTQASLTPPELDLGSEDKDKKVAKIHIHSDIDVEEMSWESLSEGAVGHSWVSLEWNDPTTVSEKVKKKHPSHAKYLQKNKGKFSDPFGFWPYMFHNLDERTEEWEMDNENRVGYSQNPFKSYVKGQMLHPDRGHEDAVKATQSFDITEDQAMDAMDYAESKKGAEYSVYFYNCTTFAEEAVKAAGKTPPKSTKAGIAYPNKLYDSIKENQEKKEGNTWLKPPGATNATTVEGEERKANR